MNKLDLYYQNLLKDILENVTKKETRNGGTRLLKCHFQIKNEN